MYARMSSHCKANYNKLFNKKCPLTLHPVLQRVWSAVLEFRVLKLYGFPPCSNMHGTQPRLLFTAHSSSLPTLVPHHITYSQSHPPARLFTSRPDGQFVHKMSDTVLQQAPSVQDRKVRIPLRTWVGLGILGKGIPWFQEAGKIPH